MYFCSLKKYKIPVKKIKTALISVFDKEGMDEILSLLNADDVKFLSTGGTRDYIKSLGYQCDAVEDLTGYPSIFGGRVKTLHPKVFGGILSRRDNADDVRQAQEFAIPDIDLVMVDLYPFEATVASGALREDIIEKIDIGGISLIRAAAKNFNDVLIVASKNEYAPLLALLKQQGASSTIEQRLDFARRAFGVSSAYDSAIFNYFETQTPPATGLRLAVNGSMPLRYAENPHQEGMYFGEFDKYFDKLNGKEISYNNLLDIDAAVNLIHEFDGQTAFAILKHNNACGLAVRPTILEAWKDALAGDPVSAFGGILIANAKIDKATAEEIDKIFCEVVIAPEYEDEAVEILCHKKNRIVLKMKRFPESKTQVRTCLAGALVQQRDLRVETVSDLEPMTDAKVDANQAEDLLFANKIVKHSKSNAIVLAKGCQLVGSGVGQTSRVDALRQAIEKARSFGFDLNGAVVASDAFFPFADCVQIAHEAGITAAIQPGGSIRDAESVDYCNSVGMAMVKTGVRHFKH